MRCCLKIYKHKGKISTLKAKLKDESEYEKYRIIQDQNFESDFDKEIKRLKGNKQPVEDVLRK